MKLYTDCDYFNDRIESPYAPNNGKCENCYRWETCIKAFMKDKHPIPINELPKYIGKSVWIQTPGVSTYGKEVTIEDVNVEERIMWLVNDFTCHDYGEVWEAYPFEGSVPETFES